MAIRDLLISRPSLKAFMLNLLPDRLVCTTPLWGHRKVLHIYSEKHLHIYTHTHTIQTTYAQLLMSSQSFMFVYSNYFLSLFTLYDVKMLKCLHPEAGFFFYVFL